MEYLNNLVPGGEVEILLKSDNLIKIAFDMNVLFS